MTKHPFEISVEDYKKQSKQRARKYKNQPIKIFGKTFDSKKESRRFQILWQLQDEGKIVELTHHFVFAIIVNEKLICKYEADFTYRFSNDLDLLIVEDVNRNGY